jgi:hypothetical protein
MILGAVAPPVLNRLGADCETIIAAMTSLLHGITTGDIRAEAIPPCPSVLPRS